MYLHTEDENLKWNVWLENFGVDVKRSIQNRRERKRTQERGLDLSRLVDSFYRNGKEWLRLKIYGRGHRFVPCHVSDTQMTVSQLGAWGFVPDNCVIFMVSETALEQVIQVSLLFPWHSSFHHCSLLNYQYRLRYAINRTEQHIITVSILKFKDVISLICHLFGHRKTLIWSCMPV